MLSQAGLQAVLASATKKVFLDCLTITHSEIETLRLVNDTQDFVRSNGVYRRFPFKVKAPQQVTGRPPSIEIQADAVDQSIMLAIRSLVGKRERPKITYEVVIANTPKDDTVLIDPDPTEVDYVCYYDDTIIFKNGQPIATGNSGSVGTIPATQGDIFSSNNFCQFMADDAAGGGPLAPLRYKSTGFAFLENRSWPAVMHFYVPYGQGDATVKVTVNHTDFNSPDHTLVISEGDIGTITLTTVSGANLVRIQSDVPILGHAHQTVNNSDHLLLMPMDTEVLLWRGGSAISLDGSSSTGQGADPITVGAGVKYTNSVPLSATSIADGSGEDAEQGIPTSLIGDRYICHHPTASFSMVADEPCIVSAYYWSGGQWNLHGTYDFSDAVTNDPKCEDVGLTSGADPTLQSGAFPWKFEGTGRFYIRTNNNVTDDEYPMIPHLSTDIPSGIEYGPVEFDFDGVSTQKQTVNIRASFLAGALNDAFPALVFSPSNRGSA